LATIRCARASASVTPGYRANVSRSDDCFLAKNTVHVPTSLLVMLRLRSRGDGRKSSTLPIGRRIRAFSVDAFSIRLLDARGTVGSEWEDPARPTFMDSV
jgi:hypothetical protein